jgi:hypothetical protein
VESRDIAVLKALDVTHFRIEFFDESAERCAEIVREYTEKVR